MIGHIPNRILYSVPSLDALLRYIICKSHAICSYMTKSLRIVIRTG